MTIQRLPAILALVFLVLLAAVWLACGKEPRLDRTALIVADVVMLMLSLGGWAMLRRTVGERPQAFIRGVYGTTMLRLFVCLIGIVSYALINRGHLYKPTLFVMFGIYCVYMVVETLVFSRTAKSA